MTFSAIADLVSGKKPVWLFKLEFGTDTVYYTTKGGGYSDPNFDMFSMADFFGLTDFFHLPWTASPIVRSTIIRTSQVKRGKTDIIFPRSDTYIQYVRDNFSAMTSNMTIYKRYLNDPDLESVVMFSGRIVAVEPGLLTIKLTCENNNTVNRRKVLAATMQSPCRHAHYFDPGSQYAGCKLNIDDWKISGTVSAVVTNTVTCAEAATKDDGYFSGGIIVYGAYQQMILKHVGSALTLLAIPYGLDTYVAAHGSASVFIAPGCNLSLQMCSAIFQNTDNFGGFSYMRDSPYDGRNPF